MVCGRYSNYLSKIFKDVIITHTLQMIRSKEGTYLAKGGRFLNSGLSDSTSESFPFTSWPIMASLQAPDRQAPGMETVLVEFTQKPEWSLICFDCWYSGQETFRHLG